MKFSWLIVVASFVATFALLMLLSGTVSTTPHRETIDGVECMVRQNAFGKVMALDCNWSTR